MRYINGKYVYKDLYFAYCKWSVLSSFVQRMRTIKQNNFLVVVWTTFEPLTSTLCLFLLIKCTLIKRFPTGFSYENATTNGPTIDFIFGCLKSETNIQIKCSILFFQLINTKYDWFLRVVSLYLNLKKKQQQRFHQNWMVWITEGT